MGHYRITRLSMPGICKSWTLSKSRNGELILTEPTTWFNIGTTQNSGIVNITLGSLLNVGIIINNDSGVFTNQSEATVFNYAIGLIENLRLFDNAGFMGNVGFGLVTTLLGSHTLRVLVARMKLLATTGQRQLRMTAHALNWMNAGYATGLARSTTAVVQRFRLDTAIAKEMCLLNVEYAVVTAKTLTTTDFVTTLMTV